MKRGTPRRRTGVSPARLGQALVIMLLFGGAVSVAWAQDGPHLQVQLGHSIIVTSVAFSPSGRLVLTTDANAQMKLWDVDTGWLIRTFPEQAASAAFSPDGRYIVSSSGLLGDAGATLWDVASGKPVRTFTGSPYAKGRGRVLNLWFSPGGDVILGFISHFPDLSELVLWRADAGRTIRTVLTKKDVLLDEDVAFSADGRILMLNYPGADSGGPDVEHFFDTLTGQDYRALQDGSPGFTSEGGRTLVSYVGYLPGNEGSITTYDCLSGQIIRRIATKADGFNVAFSPDSSTFLTWNWGEHLRLWSTASGQPLLDLGAPEEDWDYDTHKRPLFLHNGKKVLIFYQDAQSEKLKLWDLSVGGGYEVTAYAFDGISSREKLAISPDDNYLLSFGTGNDVLSLTDLRTGGSLRTFSWEKGLTQAQFLPQDGRALLGGRIVFDVGIAEKAGSLQERAWKVLDGQIGLSLMDNGTIRMWNAATDQDVRTFGNPGDRVGWIDATGDGRVVLSVQRDGTVSAWDGGSGRLVRRFAGPSGEYYFWTAVSPDGRSALIHAATYSGTLSSSVTWVDLTTGRVVATVKPDDGVVRTFAFSADSRKALVGTNHGQVTLLDSSGRQSVFPFRLAVDSFLFLPDGKSAWVGSASGELGVLDLASGRLDPVYKSQYADGFSVLRSPDGMRILCVHDSGVIEVLDATTTPPLLRYATFVTPEGEWLAWTPEGFFAGTEWATHHLVHIVDGLNVVGIDQVYNLYYRPDLVAAKAQGRDISSYARGQELASLLHGANGGLPPSVEILGPAAGAADAREVQVRVRVSDRGGGIGRVTLFNGDAPVVLSDQAGSRGLLVVPASAGAGTEYRAVVSLHGGTNMLSVSAYNKANTVESRRVSVQLEYKLTASGKPDLWVLAAAITRYLDGDLQLKYPVADATSLSQALRRQEGGLYGAVHILTLYDEKATRQGLASAFAQLAGQVNPEDVFVLYIAGHGVTYDRDGEYYFLPVDFRYTDAGAIAAQGISKDDITKGMAQIRAQKSLLFFDTCNSGSFLNGPVTRGIAEKTAVDRLAHAVGRATIVASSRDEVALEGYENHGVFTWALLQGLGGAADERKRGYVSVKGLSAYVENEVPELTMKMAGYEQVPQSVLPQEDFPLVKDLP